MEPGSIEPKVPGVRAEPQSLGDLEVRSLALAATDRGVAIAGCDDASLPVRFVNAALERMWGCSAEELIGRPLFPTGCPGAAAALREVCSTVIDGRRSCTVTLLQSRKDGSTFWNEIAVSPVLEQDGTVGHVVALQQDVSDREVHKRRLELEYTTERRALQDSLAERWLLEAVLEEMPSAVLIIEVPSGRVIRSNARAAEVLGPGVAGGSIASVWREWLPRRHDGELYSLDDRPSARAARGVGVEEEQLQLEHLDGRRVDLLVRSAPVRDDTGFAVASVIVIDDITERVHTEERLVRERERSVDLADTLQRGLLPSTLPESDWLGFGAAYLPVSEGLDVGGDFYDVFGREDGSWVVAIGDVMGKGADAATTTSVARHAIRTASLSSDDPLVLLSTLNKALLAEGADRPFCTVALGVLRRTEQGTHLRLCLGGHPCPFVARADGSVQPVGEPGTLLGAVEAVELQCIDIELHLGDAVIFYTDGVSEAPDGDGLLGEEGLQRILEKRSGQESAAALAQSVQSEVVERSGCLRDDAAVVVVRVEGTRSVGS